MGSRHVVTRGECLATIAHRYGFSDATDIQNHPDNAEFKSRRPEPNLLFPGDEIAIPDSAPDKTLTLATGKRHVVVIKQPPFALTVRLLDLDRTAYKNQDYQLFVDGALLQSDVTADGQIKVPLPITARHVRLVAGDYEWAIEVAGLNPIDQTDDQGESGVLGRLHSLGYQVDVEEGDLAAPRTRAAIRWFQRDHGLDPTGDLTSDTQAAIVSAFGC